jgi:GNAT superfamily N-acetyltransferase
MNIRFTSLREQQPGIIASLLKRSYAELVAADPVLWSQEARNWEEFDQEVFQHPDTVGSCVFLTWAGGQLVGFGSYDPRGKPEYGVIGHNCILPEFRGKGLGKQQIQEILRRFQTIGIRTAKVSTNDHPFFVPAQRMYTASGFREVGRISWDRDPRLKLIEYEKEIG